MHILENTKELKYIVYAIHVSEKKLKILIIIKQLIIPTNNRKGERRVYIYSKLSTDLERFIGCEGERMIGKCLRNNLPKLSVNCLNDGLSSGVYVQQSHTRSYNYNK